MHNSNFGSPTAESTVMKRRDAIWRETELVALGVNPEGLHCAEEQLVLGAAELHNALHNIIRKFAAFDK